MRAISQHAMAHAQTDVRCAQAETVGSGGKASGIFIDADQTSDAATQQDALRNKTVAASTPDIYEIDLSRRSSGGQMVI